MATLLFTKIFLGFCLLLLAGFTSPGSSRRISYSLNAVAGQSGKQATLPEGAWVLQSSTGAANDLLAGNTAVRLMADGFFSVAYYNKDNKKFTGTYGGTYTLANGKLTERYEFNTFDSTKVGTEATATYTLLNDKWQVKGADGTDAWAQLQENKARSPLAGAWRITGRLGRDGLMSPMQQGPRKTIKILSGSRFQWIAFNSETAVFSGTGGGTYTWQNGKYTETLEFFSRDSSRVGQALTFDYSIRNNEWHHSGLSSTGTSVNEIWKRLGR